MGALHAIHAVKEEDQPAYDAERKPGGFTMLPDAVRRFAASRKDPFITQVYVTLAAHANRNGVCWPSQPRIAEESGVSERKARNIIALLVETGIVRADRKSHGVVYTIVPGDQIPAIIEPSDRHPVPPSDINDTGDRHPVPPSDRHVVPGDRHSVPDDRHVVPVKVAPGAGKLDKRTISKELEDIPSTTDANDSPKPTKPPTPFQLLDAMCDEQGQDVTVLTETQRTKQCAVTKRLALDGLTETDMRHFMRWALGWASGIDAFFVEKHLPRWRLDGSPDGPTNKSKPDKPLPPNHPKSGRILV